MESSKAEFSTNTEDVQTDEDFDPDGVVPTVTITGEPDPSLYRQNSLGSSLARRRCVVRLDGHRYTIGWSFVTLVCLSVMSLVYVFPCSGH
ncbi:hypothetical protein BaRGS_00014329 [Batillaria attramentaria]|uniref:Uncharacterized protein n=1 Tax=Batillaria attramentaria TaxID=370345 RepID=A0ABD0L534_9CAEN